MPKPPTRINAASRLGKRALVMCSILVAHTLETHCGRVPRDVETRLGCEDGVQNQLLVV